MSINREIVCNLLGLIFDLMNLKMLENVCQMFELDVPTRLVLRVVQGNTKANVDIFFYFILLTRGPWATSFN